MKTMFGILMIFFFGCGYSTSQRDLVVSPAGATVNESGHCVGLDCGNGYSPGYGAAYGPWNMGPASYQGLAPSWGRLGAIEAYRAQNQWVRSPGGSPSGEARDPPAGRQDPRLERLVPHLQRMTNVLCRNGTLSGDDCATPRRMQNETALSAAQPAATSAPATPALQEAAPQAETPPTSDSQTRPAMTEDPE